MPRRRPLLRLLAALGAVALLTLVVASCGGDDGGDDDPRSLLRTAAAKEMQSADVELSTDADIPGFPILGSRLAITGGGPIASNGPDSLPTLDWDVSLRAGGQGFPARLTAVDGRAYVEFQGLAYEADPELIEQLGIGGDGEGARRTPMSLRQFGIDPSRWLADPQIEDGDDVGGDSTRLITGRVDERAVLDDLLAVATSDDERSGALPDVSGDDLDQVADAIDRARVEVNVDDDDNPRRVYAELRFTVPESVEDTAIEDGTVEVELLLEELDVEVDPQAPAGARPLDDLLRFVGVIFGVEELSDLWQTPR